MGRSAPTAFIQAVTDALISVATLSLSFRSGALFYRRFLSRENVRNQYVIPHPTSHFCFIKKIHNNLSD